MRVLHWYPNFLGGGGVANAVLGLARAQAHLGAKVAIVSAEPHAGPLYGPMETHGVQLLTWRPKWRLQLAGLTWRAVDSRLASGIRSFSPDIVHIHGEFNPDNLWVPTLLRCPLVLSPHGAFHPVALRKSRPLAKRLYISLAKRLLYSKLSAFHALTPAEANHVRDVQKHALLYTVPQGPNPGVPLHNTQVASQDAVIRFVFIGRLDVYTKGLDLLVQAFAQATQHLPHVPLQLTLVGPDWRGGKPFLEKLARRFECVQRLRFTGPLPAHAVHEELLASHCYIQLSRHEGFPLAVAEALVLGRPAILSSEIGTATYTEIRDLPHVRVVALDVEEAAKAIIEFARSPHEFQRLAQQHVNTVRAFFSWERVAKEHLEAYATLLS